MTNLKYGHKYPSHDFNEPEKYLPSFFLKVPFDNQIVKAEIRPLKKDKGYFTVILNNVFLAHIHSVQGEWLDFLGKTHEIYKIVGKMIEERKE
jgi:hypothetical protein